MNFLDDKIIDVKGFAYRDILGQDRWESFTPTFTSLTVVGDTNYSGRCRIVGRSVFFQTQFSAGTSIESTAGTTYFALPITSKGLSGVATMQNKSTNVAVGVCVIDTTNSRCYIPTQSASASVFLVSGWYEI